ncbi:hypothetical protein [Nitrosopumilus piranensis]|uniref:Uncharacterized protein n=1 Tax=Nitrosopumilus piranensis TaxID=1582439 RepID=A0A0C5BXN1_9ARCH|nr:hypothetical protein [Nitrosopumilus piranensis]AJM93046.1 exported protein of unknown function [Nitrosopumilus piranensis]
MKTRLLIILGIIFTASLSMYAAIDYDNNNKTPREFSISNYRSFDRAQEQGMPYLSVKQLNNPKLTNDGSTIVILEVDMQSSKYSGSWAILEPVVNCQYASFKDEILGQAYMVEPCTIQNQHKNTIVKSEYVKPLQDKIYIKANYPILLPVEIDVPEEHLDKFQNVPFEVKIGFKMLDSNFEKLPKQIDMIEIYSEQ